MVKKTRALLIIGSLIVFIFAGGYFVQAPWAVVTWPWSDGRLTYIFIASILAAIGAALLWIGISQEWGQIAAGAINLMVTIGGITLYLSLLAMESGQARLLIYIAGGGISVVANLIFLLWAYRVPVGPLTPIPKVVTISYALFTAILILVGVALILQTPNVMPWPLQPETSILIGFIFLGDAFYFLYGFLRPYWQYARAQLWSFLAYDIVLLGPLLGHLANVQPEHRTSLLIYITVLVYSGALAIYYLVPWDLGGFIRET